jgi:3-ketosteroid 9alpha-monooxygenase subunit B
VTGRPARDFHQLKVADVVQETDDACSLVLAVPPELAGTFAYRPGQFLTLRVPHEDGSVARCYSLSSSPHAGDAPTITVKRMAGGHASNWIADHVRPGCVLDTLPPAGTFCPRTLDGDFLLFAAGSGITPVMSILKSALAEGRGHILLCYANRDERSVIFARDLRGLAERAGTRLTVLHWLDSLLGPPTAAALATLARPYAGREAFLCGPDPFMATVRQALGQLGVPAARVHAERFLSLADNPFEAGPDADTGGVAATLEVTLDGQTRTLAWPPGTRMLDRLIDEGLDPPFSCREGVCGACACELVSGKVEMAHNEVLEEADLADGLILACQAVPRTDAVSIRYP